MERWPHRGALAGAGPRDVVLDDRGDGIDLVDARRIRHGGSFHRDDVQGGTAVARAGFGRSMLVAEALGEWYRAVSFRWYRLLGQGLGERRRGKLVAVVRTPADSDETAHPSGDER